jgi:hypothetical protein
MLGAGVVAVRAGHVTAPAALFVGAAAGVGAAADAGVGAATDTPSSLHSVASVGTSVASAESNSFRTPRRGDPWTAPAAADGAR